MAARPFEGFRNLKLAEVNARYEAYLADGFATAEFDGQPALETLQCRNELDRTNWIGLLLKCQAASALGLGSELIDPPIRCTSNRMYAVSHDDAQGRMWTLFAQVAAAQANWWRLKDLVRDAPTRASLAEIDLNEGWP